MQSLKLYHSQRLSTARRMKSYLDRAPSWYEHHTRVFYIYSLGRYQNQALFCYGETNDLDTVEFHLAKTLPTYQRVLYFPVQDNYNREHIDATIKTMTNTVVLGVGGLDDWNIFTCDDINEIVNRIDLRKSADLE